MKLTPAILTIAVVAIMTAPGIQPALAMAQDKELQEKKDPRENLDTAIAEGIRLLKGKEYKPFIEKFTVPSELEAITEEVPLEDIVKEFPLKAPLVLKILEVIKDKHLEPTLSDKGSVATYSLEEPIDSIDSITFIKTGKYWHISNGGSVEVRMQKSNDFDPGSH